MGCSNDKVVLSEFIIRMSAVVPISKFDNVTSITGALNAVKNYIRDLKHELEKSDGKDKNPHTRKVSQG